MGPLFASILTILCVCSTAVHIALQRDDILHYTRYVDTLDMCRYIGILFTASTVKITITATNAADCMMHTAPPLRKLRKTPRLLGARVSGPCAGGGLGQQRTRAASHNPRPPAVAGAAVHCSATVLWSGDRTIPGFSIFTLALYLYYYHLLLVEST